MLSMADTQQAEEHVEAAAGTAADKRAGRRTAKLTKQIRAFADTHGGSAEGQLAHIGRGRIRIALVGANGEWGNLVADSFDSAKDAATAAGVTLQDDFDGDLAARVRTGRYEWSRMAGIQVGGPANA
ncbi:hypothetical protein RB199_33930 [Streptomyces libani]|uniref:Uncharacterized protein n=1 Tax=Streptomyces nigrescens TaxID=1920 RepID=A0ABY7J9B2_STRNI|nr:MULTISPECIES: hypothetical protein [Streptomyces]MCW7989850.1 hypothetical protein [Streptomyces platensis subsp. clarensis]MCX5450322.1 hypothetical protein [Streptomyces libani]MYX06850.1 hypothetical protein [Streptomyces sp. SID8375]WAU07644.1 hypothetical protein STRNI_006267 [Streptomyces nigrescens]WDT54550.1 hypothetical protein NUT86_11065 [Streptomyces sp. G7(2002)]